MQRRGITVVELLAAAVLATAMVTVTLHYVQAQIAVHRATHRRSLALQQAGNTLEKIFDLPWDAIQQKQVDQYGIDEFAQKHLPGGRLQVKLRQTLGPIASKQVTVLVTWQSPNRLTPDQIQLSAWRFHQNQEAP